MIGVDLDTGEVFPFLKTYFRAKNMFPEDKIDVFYSPSGKGFHFRINTTAMNVLDHLCKRAMLGDDPYRIAFSLKRYGMGGTSAHNIMFKYKNKGFEKPLDIEGILAPYKKEVDRIMKGLENQDPKVDEKVHELSDKIKDKIETLHTWLTCFGLDNAQGEIAKKVSQDIADKDPSFKWRLHKSFYPEHECVLVIYSPDKDTAHKRGTWFVNRVPELKGVLYWVKELKGKE